MEGENLEYKIFFDGSDKSLFEILKTIVAFANCEGGKIIICKYGSCKIEDILDSSRIEDKIRKYVDPPISGIKSGKENGHWAIIVNCSSRAPHIFKETSPQFKNKKGKTRHIFYRGQVYVRHASKTETATHEDFDRIIKRIVSLWLERLGEALKNAGLELASHASALPVRIDKDAPLALGIDPNRSHPYTAKSLAKEIGTNQNWVADAAQN